MSNGKLLFVEDEEHVDSLQRFLPVVAMSTVHKHK